MGNNIWNMIGGVQPKILLTMDENGKLQMDDGFKELLYGDPKMNWRLVRERDGLTKESNDITWLEFDENGRGKERHNEPGIGRSLIMSPFNDFFTWQTSTITEVVEERDDYVEFKTKNSNYKLSRITE